MHNAAKQHASEDKLHRQRCLRCGYQGQEIQSSIAPDGERVATSLLRCPRCAQDLYTRPPRSYAELEGLITPALPARLPPPRRVWKSFAGAGPETDNDVIKFSYARETPRAPMRPGVIAAVAMITMTAVVAAILLT